MGNAEVGAGPARTIRRGVAGVTLVTLVSQVSGLGRDSAIAGSLGPTSAVDQLLTALVFPNLAMLLVQLGIAPALVRELRRVESAASLTTLAAVCSGVFGAVALLATGVGAVAAAAAAPFGFPSLLTIASLSPLFVLWPVQSVFAAQLQIRGYYWLSLIGSVASNVLVVVMVILFGQHLDSGSIALGLALGSLAALGAMKSAAQLRHPAAQDFRALRRITVRSAPIVGVLVCQQVAVVLDRLLALNHGPGGVLALDLGSRTVWQGHSFVVSAVYTVLYPAMIEAFESDGMVRLTEMSSRALRLLLVLGTGMAVTLLAAAEPIVAALYGRGRFTADATALTSYVVAAYSLALLPGIASSHLARTFYSAGDYVTPFRFSVVRLAISVPLAFGLVTTLGIPGLGLAFALAIWVYLLLLLRVAREQGYIVVAKSWWARFAVVWGVSVAVFGCLRLLAAPHEDTRLLALGAAALTLIASVGLIRALLPDEWAALTGRRVR